MLQEASKVEVEKLMGRLLKSGRMKRLPKGKKDQDVFLALAASVLDPREVYSEPLLNEQLADWLSGFVRTSMLDHVTVRRYLVDLGFLLRDISGSTYRSNQTVINAVISLEARMVQPALIHEQQSQARDLRRREHSNEAT